tara:strand:+ start:190 stop:732 length:543 start_codon:yes stop_codon:yes gene_type:complete
MLTITHNTRVEFDKDAYEGLIDRCGLATSSTQIEWVSFMSLSKFKLQARYHQKSRTFWQKLYETFVVFEFLRSVATDRKESLELGHKMSHGASKQYRSKPIRLLEKINQLKLPHGTVADYEKNPEIKKIYPAEKDGGTIYKPGDSLGRDLRKLAAQKKICSNPKHSKPRLFWAHTTTAYP